MNFINAKTFLSKNVDERKLLLFFLKLFLIWLSWKAIIFILSEQSVPLNERFFPVISAYWEAWNLSLVHFIINNSCAIIKMMGYKAYTQHRTIWIEGANGVSMGNYCIGVQLMYYNSMLILITPITRLRKVVGIPVGIVITFFLNFIRVISLCFVQLYIPKYVEYAHDHIFNIIVFGTLMAFYYYLIKEKKGSAPSIPLSI